MEILATHHFASTFDLRAIVELECQVAGENDPEIRRVGPVKAGVSSTEFVAILEVHLGSGFWCNEVSRQVRPDDEADATYGWKNTCRRRVVPRVRVGCGAETARCQGSVRDAATEGFTKLIDIIAGQLTNIRPDTARKRALVVMSTMIGALTMSRIVDEPGLSDTILRQAERHIRDFLAGK